MRFINRLGLSFMIMVVYAQLTWLYPDDFTQLQKGALHILFMIGYALFLLSRSHPTDE